MLRSIIVRLTVILFLLDIAICENHILHTNLGPVRGIISTEAEGTVFKFLKVPYARPPVGYLRFRKPVPVDPWTDVVGATQHPPSCIQLENFYTRHAQTDEISEDCLYLSIYVPNDISNRKNRSVMVWIHGGAYDFGQASAYDGSHLALVGDVIVVMINYRLNIFGFLTTWDSAARGNYGLWDQILALKWVKRNIETFGGDSNSITIFGQSAGGFSVNLLSLMPQNKGLFHRVIAQSGTANSLFALNNKFQTHLYNFIRKVGCYGKAYKNSYSVVDCLRKLPAETLINANENVFIDGIENHLTFMFAPTIDFELINHDPVKMINNPRLNKLFRSLDLMAGTTSAEGSWILPSVQNMAPNLPINITEGIPKEFLCDILVPNLSEKHFKTNWKVSKSLCEMYESRRNEDIEQGKKIIELAGDAFFNYAAVEGLQAHTSLRYESPSTTYQYMFSRKYPDPFPSWFSGAGHASELAYLFGLRHYANVDNITLSEMDYNFAEKMMKYWTNFAKYGNPNSEGLPNWPQYTKSGKEYIDLNLQIVTKSDAFGERMKFWSEKIPRTPGYCSNI